MSIFLSHRRNFGGVSRSGIDRVTIEVQGQALYLSEAEYWLLMEILSEASVKLAERNVKTRTAGIAIELP